MIGIRLDERSNEEVIIRIIRLRYLDPGVYRLVGVCGFIR